MEDPQISAMPRLELVVRGMKRMQAGVASKPRLPITPEILHKIRAAVGSHHAVGYDVPMLLWLMSRRSSGPRGGL